MAIIDSYITEIFGLSKKEKEEKARKKAEEEKKKQEEIEKAKAASIMPKDKYDAFVKKFQNKKSLPDPIVKAGNYELLAYDYFKYDVEDIKKLCKKGNALPVAEYLDKQIKWLKGVNDDPDDKEYQTIIKKYQKCIDCIKAYPTALLLSWFNNKGYDNRVIAHFYIAGDVNKMYYINENNDDMDNLFTGSMSRLKTDIDEELPADITVYDLEYTEKMLNKEEE